MFLDIMEKKLWRININYHFIFNLNVHIFIREWNLTYDKDGNLWSKIKIRSL